MIREKRLDNPAIEENMMPNEPSDHESANEADQSGIDMAKDREIEKTNCESCNIRQDKITRLQKRIHNLKKRRDELKANAQQEVSFDSDILTQYGFQKVQQVGG